MSTTVDNKVVEMRFDNKQFEDNVQTSISTLDKLKRSLNLTGATKGLEDVDTAAKRVDMSKLGGAVETVQNKFSAMEIMAVTALMNITNSAVNAGKRVVSALTIDPIKMGFSEYETQINAVQTILANTESKGKTLKDVNAALDELNAYADKTIYNFTEMTRNIGTFTAAGVDLDTSVAAIKGIANLAAVSGSTSQQASTAMYQLSQALASGTVKLMDWNSVVNAGMGGQVFQDALKETARVHGVAIDDMIESEGSFRETLSNGWLTSEILTETLSKFTGDLNEEQLKTMGYTEEQIKSIIKMGQTANDAATKVKTFSQLFDTLKEAAQSGWTQTWEILVGDFEEAKVMLTEVSDTIGAMIGSSAEARNKMLSDWKELGGRTVLIDSIKNAFKGIMSIITPVKEAFREIFPPMTAKRLFSLTEGLKSLTEKFKIGEKTANNLKRTFKGAFAILDIGVQIIKSIASGFADLVGFIAPAGDGILGFTAKLGDGIVKFNEFLKSGNVFNKFVKKITSVLGKIIEGVRNFVSAIGSAFKEFSNIDTSGVDEFTDKMKLRFQPLTKLGEGIANIFKALGKVLQKIAPFFFTLASKIGEMFSGLADGITEAVSNADFDAVMDLINGLLTGGLILGFKKFIDQLSNITENAGGFLENIVGILEGVKGTLEAYQSSLKAKTLLKIAAAIAILAGALVVLSMIDSNKLGTALAAITTMFIELFGSMAIFQKLMDGKSFKGMIKTSTAMIGLSTAVLILSVAMKNLASLDWEGVVKGLIGVATLSTVLVISAKSLSKSEGKLIKGATGLIAFAAAILILSKAVEKLGGLDARTLVKGLIGVGVLCTELALFLKVSNLDGGGLLKGIGLMALAGAVNILATAVGKFGSLDVNSLLKGLAGVTVVLAELAIFVNVTSNAKKVISTGIGLTILASAMLIFAKAVSNMSALSWQEIGKGLATMGATLALVTAAMNLLPKNMVSSGIGMIAVSTALIILSKALNSMGGMTWEEIAKGLVTLAGSLTIITVAMTFMKTALPGAAALLVISSALAMLAPVLWLFSNFSWEEMARGLLTLAGVFTVLGAAGFILAPIAPIILTLAGSIVLLGVGCLAAGAGVLAFSAGLTALSIAGTAGATALVAIVSSLISLIPYLIKQIGEGIVAFLKVIANSADAICDAVTAVFIAVIEAITRSIPPLMECVGVLLDNLLIFIVDYVPKLVDAGMQLIIGLLTGIANNIDDVVAAAIEVIISFLDGIARKIPDVIQSGVNIILSFINGMADSIRNNTQAMIDATNNLLDSMVDSMVAWIENGSNIVQVGKDLINGLINGILNMGGDLFGALHDVVDAAWGGVLDFFGIHSPSRVAADAGMNIDKGLANGLEEYAKVAGNAALDVGKTTVNSLSEAVNGISDVIDNDIDSSPTIRPVLDLTEIQNGASQLNGMFKDQTIALGDIAIGNSNALASIAAEMEKANKAGNVEVVSAIYDLRADLGSLADHISNLQIVMDSGALVGELITKIDDALGQISVYKGRGN